MRAGGGKAKGSAFERWVCKRLSKWVTHNKREDVFWRSAMSGGRSTVARAKGIEVRQAGDITAVAPEGNNFCRHWYVECKHYSNLQVGQFLLMNTGVLTKFWQLARSEAKRRELRPMLIVKQNAWPVLVITEHDALGSWTESQLRSYARQCDVSFFNDMLLTKYYEDR